MEINQEKCKSFRKGRKAMKLWIITLQFQLKKQRNKYINKIIIIRINKTMNHKTWVK